MRNNSAWNQRYFVLQHKPDAVKLASEVDYVVPRIHLSPHNEATWLYLRRYAFSLLSESTNSLSLSILRLLTKTSLSKFQTALEKVKIDLARYYSDVITMGSILFTKEFKSDLGLDLDVVSLIEVIQL